MERSTRKTKTSFVPPMLTDDGFYVYVPLLLHPFSVSWSNGPCVYINFNFIDPPHTASWSPAAEVRRFTLLRVSRRHTVQLISYPIFAFVPSYTVVLCCASSKVMARNGISGWMKFDWITKTVESFLPAAAVTARHGLTAVEPRSCQFREPGMQAWMGI